jgi:geranylgeranyl pyrophosphate synthase
MAEAVAEPSAAALLAEAREEVDRLLGEWADRLAAERPGRIGEALAYALRTPGKRVRAALVMASYRSVGGRSPAIVGVASAIETVHTYSLVHDDLPCMDDDDMRRGRPTTHRQFDVPIATRAGFLLVPVAARVLSKAVAELRLPTATLGRLASELFEAGGIQGMVGGQWLDLEAERRRLDLDGLIRMHAGKTGALIRAACAMGGITGGGRGEHVAALTAYGEEIGLAFQIADDVLDATGTSEALGKTAGRDAELAKSTYVSLLGVDGAREAAALHARRAVDHLEGAGLRTPELTGLADFIITRGH